MSLPVFVEGWFAVLIAFALVLWVCTTMPFRVGMSRVAKDPVRGMLLLAPGVIGVLVLRFVPGAIEWDGGGWLGRRLVYGVVIGGVVGLVQLGGLAMLLAREHGKTAGAGIVTALVPIVAVSVLVPVANEVLFRLLHLLFDWTGFMGWFVRLVMLAVYLVEIVLAWFAIKWALNLFTRSVLGLGHPDAAYEVDAQFTADSLGWTIWPFAVLLGLVVPASVVGLPVEMQEFVRSGLGGLGGGLEREWDLPVRWVVQWPNVLAPQMCTWQAALPWADRGFFAFFWDLVFVVLVVVMVVGFVEAYVRHRGTFVGRHGVGGH
jgi:hypothetical protein